MKVGDLVKHRTGRLGVIICDDVEKNNGDIIVLYSTIKHRKVIKSHPHWLEVINESR